MCLSHAEGIWHIFRGEHLDDSSIVVLLVNELAV